MYLVDTNVFLEILLEQPKRNACKAFLDHNDPIYISDFAVHSIGVILFRESLKTVFQKFTEKILPHLQIVYLPSPDYQDIVITATRLNLDFDDTYQYLIAKYHILTLVTLDSDFRNVADVPVIFL